MLSSPLRRRLVSPTSSSSYRAPTAMLRLEEHVVGSRQVSIVA